jgi:hypothetical protein
MTPAQKVVAAIGVVTICVLGIVALLSACFALGVSDFIEGVLCGAYAVTVPRFFARLDET